jgi:hypothetical protein
MAKRKKEAHISGPVYDDDEGDDGDDAGDIYTHAHETKDSPSVSPLSAELPINYY